MQADSYSLDVQKYNLKKYADYQEMSIVWEYSDEGNSARVWKEDHGLGR